MKLLLNTKLRILLSICLACCVTLARSEEIMGKVTPQTANFMRYGNIPTSLHEGKIHFTVPIFEIPDKDFPFSIALTYTSDGFKPFKPAGLVGMDWNLNAGGVITRETYGVADDHEESLQGGLQYKGFWAAIKMGRTYDKNEIYDQKTSLFNAYGYYKDLPALNGYYHDYQPDLFQFRFGNHNGSFMISNDGTVLCNQPGYRINLAGLSGQYRGSFVNRSEIIITTPDGYEWAFGGSGNTLEYAFPYEADNMMVWENVSPTITGWHLHKVKAPNGRTMYFDYEEEMLSGISTPQFLTNASQDPVNNNEIRFQATKGAYLKRIRIEGSDLSIDFGISYEANPTNWWPHAQYNKYANKLDHITINWGTAVYVYHLTYDKSKGRRFLAEVRQDGLSPYRFEYYHPTSYPALRTLIPVFVDHWGYGLSNTVDTGLLSTITYPTGGYSTFTYEGNAYGEVVETLLSDSSLDFPLPVLKARDGNAGGSRIKKVTHYSEQGTVASSVEYLYVKSYTPGMNLATADRSGTLFQSPYKTTGPLNQIITFLNQIWSKNYNIGEPHIGYQEVAELYQDGSCIVNRFTNYFSNQDTPDVNLICSAPTDQTVLAANNTSVVCSRSYARGHLSERMYYDATGKVVKRNRYNYKHIGRVSFPIPNDPHLPSTEVLDYVVSYIPVWNGGLSRKIYLPYCPVTWEWELMESDYPEKWTWNTYDDSGLLKECKTIDSRMDSIKIVYSYTGDAPNSSVYNTMRTKNMLNSLMGKKEFHNGVLVRQETYDYAEVAGGIAVRDKSIRIGLAAPRIEASYKYDTKLNIKERTSKGLTTAYVWSYKGMYPVAKVEGKTAEQVEIALGSVNLSILENHPTDQQVKSMFHALRAALPDALITTYTYTPLKGVTSITDPKNHTVYYDYDALGRLITTYFKNDQGRDRILKSYQYHYVNP